MKLKKILAGAMVGAMVLSAAPVVPNIAPTSISTAYAAKGGAKLGGGSMRTPSAAPSTPKASAPSSSSSSSKSVSGNGNSYQPSKSAKDLNKEAPAANSRANNSAATNANNRNNANTQQSGSRWGSALRNIGLFAGGMFLGSMLSHALGGLGFGTGMLGDIFGLIFNIIMLVVLFMIIRWLWNKFRGNNNNRRGGSNGGNYYNNYGDGNRDLNMRGPQDNSQRMSLHDDAEQGYNAKRTADRYRNR